MQQQWQTNKIRVWTISGTILTRKIKIPESPCPPHIPSEPALDRSKVKASLQSTTEGLYQCFTVTIPFCFCVFNIPDIALMSWNTAMFVTADLHRYFIQNVQICLLAISMPNFMFLNTTVHQYHNHTVNKHLCTAAMLLLYIL